jgi:hypothetical protein
MNRDTYYSFCSSIEILRAISEDENWVLKLSESMHGLNKEIARIPLIQEPADMIFMLRDLEKFAIESLKETVPAEVIAAIIDKNCVDIKAYDLHFVRPLVALDLEQLEFDQILRLGGEEDIPFLNATPDANGNIQLGRDVVASLSHAVRRMADVQFETSCVLKTLAMALTTVEYPDELSSEEAEVLATVASSMWERARDNAGHLHELFN